MKVNVALRLARLAIGPVSTSSNLQVFWRSLALVGVAELFDKTWFMGLLLALRYPPYIVFVGSFAALFLHCFFAAAFGLAFARLIPHSVLNFLAAGLFTFFAALYAWDWYKADADGDAIAVGREEAEQDCGFGGPGDQKSDSVKTDGKGKAAVAADGTASKASDIRVAFTKSFIGVFLAEWGDRTQIAMIGQHASQPLIPVFAGSAIAFFLLTLSAVGLASVAGKLKLSEKMVHGVGALSFAVFALLALKDSFDAMGGAHALRGSGAGRPSMK
jgi:putative Ca2+/H+ antiporter (TMEM165/GDT1 family)